MCGIVALVGSQDAAPLLLEGLRQLEYRGYHSAGIATVNGERQLSCLRAEGKLINLTQRFEASGAPGHCGIGHTRWATHGKPEERNAHPHLDGPGRVAVVQNGIIENYRTLREELQAEGVVFRVLASGSANALNESGLGLSQPPEEKAGTGYWASQLPEQC
jgi:glucosamine--fructose-6-phosphate aminotransferase (isomerizing)